MRLCVLILEKVTPSLRGHLKRWLLEVKAGIFLGAPSSEVRNRLWGLVGEKLKEGSSATMIVSKNNEQGFELLSVGDPARKPVDFEGIWLIKKR